MMVEATCVLAALNRLFCKSKIITIKTIDVIANVKGLINELMRLTLIALS